MSDLVNSQSKDTETAARHDLADTAAGSIEAADKLEKTRDEDPAGVEAVEQEQSEAPQGRGLSR